MFSPKRAQLPTYAPDSAAAGAPGLDLDSQSSPSHPIQEGRELTGYSPNERIGGRGAGRPRLAPLFLYLLGEILKRRENKLIVCAYGGRPAHQRSHDRTVLMGQFDDHVRAGIND